MRFVLTGLLPGPDINLRFFGRVLHTAEPHIGEFNSFAPIKYLSSDRITIWYTLTVCSVGWSFTSHCPICDLINIHWVTANHPRYWPLFQSHSTNTDGIAHWRTGGGRASKTACFTYILYCETIRTPILNWGQSAESTKMWNRPKNCGFGGVRFFDGVKPVTMVPVQFYPGPGTEPSIWNRCYHYWNPTVAHVLYTAIYEL